MIEIRITSELNTYEPTAIGPLTLRQLICVIVGAPICYLIISKLSPILSLETAGLLCLFPASIGYAFGWAKPYGMRTEQFVKSIFVSRILAPAKRCYRTQNAHSEMLLEYDNQIATEATSKGRRQRFSPMKNYKLSPKAYQ